MIDDTGKLLGVMISASALVRIHVVKGAYLRGAFLVAGFNHESAKMHIIWKIATASENMHVSLQKLMHVVFFMDAKDCFCVEIIFVLYIKGRGTQDCRLFECD